MKAERRHELQTNALSQWLAQAPEFFNKHGTKLLVGAIFVVLAAVLVRYYVSNARKKVADARGYLTQARGYIARMDPSQRMMRGGPIPLDEAKTAEELISRARTTTRDPEIQADALVLLGDYYWALANYPPSLEAATRPSAQAEQNRADALNDAEKAYQAAIASHPGLAMAVAKARFGLAAIEENRAFALDQKPRSERPAQNAHWDRAAEYYKAVQDDPRVLPLYKDQAKEAIRRLSLLREPVVLAPATGPTTTAAPRRATSRPAATTAAPPASTGPAAVTPVPSPIVPPLPKPATAAAPKAAPPAKAPATTPVPRSKRPPSTKAAKTAP